MKPNDDNAKLPVEERPFRVLLISGSQRRQYNCPGVDSKSRTLMMKMAELLPQEWEIDMEDLGNVYSRERIQSCNACVSTSMALCVWPCNCYEKDDSAEPDLMWNLDMYSRLDMADAWAIISPVNWYGPTSNIKLMFDRLVCANGGNPNEELIKHKDALLAKELEHSPEWKELSVNHLEGRTAAIFCYGDGGGDELDETGRPKILKHKHYFDPDKEPFENERDSYAPIAWQCRYGGIEVPDHLWTYCEFGRNKKYSDNQAEHMVNERKVMSGFEKWVQDFIEFVSKKGKVIPGKFRAYGYEPPGHFFEEVRLGWKEFKMRIGKPEEGTSPQKQQDAGLNKDVTLDPKKSEGEKLRDE